MTKLVPSSSASLSVCLLCLAGCALSHEVSLVALGDTGLVLPSDGSTPPPPPRDSGVRDAGPPMRDVGPPPRDVGPPPRDVGPPPRDVGPPPRDMGPPPRDVGPPPRDVGPPPRDSGSRDDVGPPPPDASVPDGGLIAMCIAAATTECEVCGCQSCIDEIVRCELDMGCVAMSDCASATGCRGIQCYGVITPGPCRMVIDAFGGPFSDSAMLASELGDCGEVSCPAC